MLEVYAVNGELIPFDFWIIITVNLPGNENPDLSISVPFLVSSLPLKMPLIGFIVMEVVIQGSERTPYVAVPLGNNTKP